MAEIDGATVIARSLKQQGVDYMFGVVGFPVQGIAAAAQREGIRYFGFHNEQAASYAAGAVGYLTGRPGACLTVCGPGMIHGIAGMANAWSNTWPMILIGGAPDSYQDGQGSFQEAPQVEAARPFAKLSRRAESIERVPYYVEQAVRTSMYGRPGAVYLDFANDVISGRIEEADVAFRERCPDPPRTYASPASVEQAVDAMKSAERPLVIIGKGAAYARAEDEVRDFIDTTQLPFLASPMGKGVVPDDHPLSVAPARSYALQNADLVFLMGGTVELDHAFRAAAALQRERARGADGHQRRGDRHERGDGSGARGRREGGGGPAERRAGAEPLVVPPGDDVVDGALGQGRGEPPGGGRDGDGRLGADGLLSRAAGRARGDPGGRDHRQRRGEHDGHRAHGAAEHHAALAPGRGHLRHDGRGRGAGDRSGGGAPRPQGRGPWRATRASASARSRWRWPAATSCRSRSSW